MSSAWSSDAKALSATGAAACCWAEGTELLSARRARVIMNTTGMLAGAPLEPWVALPPTCRTLGLLLLSTGAASQATLCW